MPVAFVVLQLFTKTFYLFADKETGKEYVLMEQRLSELYKSADAYEVLEKFTGKQLEGLQYEPIFPYFSHLKSSTAFRVLNGTFITTDQGTGVVHQAPYFGEVRFHLVYKYT